MIRRQTIEAKITNKMLNTIGSTEVFELVPPLNIKATEFWAISHVGCSMNINKLTPFGLVERPYDGYMQVKINTSAWYCAPDGGRSHGISNKVSPYPRASNILESIKHSIIHVLPGQRLTITFTMCDGTELNNDEFIIAGVDYELYDGTDSVLADKILDWGYQVTPKNVDAYKWAITDMCKHVETYLVYDPTADIDVSEVTWRSGGHVDTGDNTPTMGKYKVVCKHCHTELPSEIIEDSALKKLFLTTEDDIKEDREQGVVL